ncbi:MAG TPA: hypothetical protein VG496_04790 [Myxococcales bacterium]|nr:hypothetical protein [Myxococcales bacterium]
MKLVQVAEAVKPLTVTVHVGAFTSDAVFPETLNSNVHPLPKVNCKSAPDPCENATETGSVTLCAGIPEQAGTFVVIDPFHCAPRKLLRFFPPPLLPPHAIATENATTTRFIGSLPDAIFVGYATRAR